MKLSLWMGIKAIVEALFGIGFAGVAMLLIGIFQSLEGLAAIVKNEFFVVSSNYLYKFDASTWGWIHLIIGVVLVLAGIAIFPAVFCLIRSGSISLALDCMGFNTSSPMSMKSSIYANTEPQVCIAIFALVSGLIVPTIFFRSGFTPSLNMAGLMIG